MQDERNNNQDPERREPLKDMTDKAIRKSVKPLLAIGCGVIVFKILVWIAIIGAGVYVLTQI